MKISFSLIKIAGKVAGGGGQDTLVRELTVSNFYKQFYRKQVKIGLAIFLSKLGGVSMKRVIGVLVLGMVLGMLNVGRG